VSEIASMTPEVRTFYFEATTAAALLAEAKHSGRTVAEVYRDHLVEPTATLRIRVVNLEERLPAVIGRCLPWDEALGFAFEDA
jgi:hypothetical protein